MKRIILSSVFIFGLLYFTPIWAQLHVFDNLEKHEGVKKITTKTVAGWKSIDTFNEEGLMLTSTHYYKGELRSDCHYKYFISDTISEVIKIDFTDSQYKHRYKYLYSDSGEIKAYDIYYQGSEIPYTSYYGFLYCNGSVVEYYKININSNKAYPIKTVHEYNDNKQVIHDFYLIQDTGDTIAIHSYEYNKDGQLTDFKREYTDKNAIISGVPTYSKNHQYKYQIRYSKFDKHGNWTVSHYITHKGKVRNAKRKIEYW